MKLFRRAALPLMTALVLVTAAHADVISVGQMAGYLVWESLPVILVIAVVIVTIVLLLHFRKKK